MMTKLPPSEPATKASSASPGGASNVGFIVAAVVLLGDLVTKSIIADLVMDPPRTIPVAPFFNLVLHYNRGVSFGFLSSGPVADAGPWVLIALSAAIVAALVVWLARTSDWWEGGALGAIIGGALGNILDRIRHGGVTDFLDFYLGNWHWPAFNLADTFITCGVAVLLLRSFVDRRSETKSQ